MAGVHIKGANHPLPAMPYYEFSNGTETVLAKTSFAGFEKLARKMRRKGFRQIYSLARPIIQLSFQEALEETDELLAQADRGEGELVGMDVNRDRKLKGDWWG